MRFVVIWWMLLAGQSVALLGMVIHQAAPIRRSARLAGGKVGSNTSFNFALEINMHKCPFLEDMYTRGAKLSYRKYLHSDISYYQ